MKPWRRIIQAVCTLIFTASMLTPTALAAEGISSHEPQPTIQTELISENFYQAVNNQWLSQTEMPADQPFYGQFAVAQDRLDTVLQADLAKMAAGEIHPESSKAQDMIAYYRLTADFNQREADGVSQARRLLAQVEQLTSFKDFEELSQDDLLRFAMLPWEFYVSPNMQDTQHYALWLATPTTFLPDKSFYDGLNPAKKQLQKPLQGKNEQLLLLYGYSAEEASQLSKQALELDEQLAPFTPDTKDRTDVTSAYNPRSRAEIEAYTDILSLSQIVETLVGQPVDRIIVEYPSYFEHLNSFLTEEDFPNFMAWQL